MKNGRALLFDVGNTRLKWGLLVGDEIRKTGSVSHEKIDETGFNCLTTRLPRRVDRVIACNVAGATFATRLTGIVHIHCDTDTRFVHSERSAFGLTNGYRQPRQLGVDRWVAMIGARAEFSSALCIVDAGTAITIDVVDRGGNHLGGQIIPGFRLMENALTTQTRGIGATGRKRATGGRGMAFFARNTDAAVQNGAIGAVCGAVEGAVRRLRSAGLKPKTVITGGDAPRILKHADVKFQHRPNLVLQGLAYMLTSEP